MKQPRDSSRELVLMDDISYLQTRRQLPLQALAIREKKVFILDSPQLPEAPVHVYLDFEGDQARRHPYLLGGIVSTGTEQRRFSFWSDDRAGEADILARLFAEISPLKDFVVFFTGAMSLIVSRRHVTPQMLI